MTRRLAMLLFTATALAACGRGRPETEIALLREPPPIRVGLLRSVVAATVGSPQPFVLSDRKGIVHVGAAGESLQVSVDGDRLVIRDAGGAPLAEGEGPYWIRPSDPQREVRLFERLYPGHLFLKRSVSGGGINVVNVVDLETYLRGVVPAEIGHKGPYLEAAKAQAIAARTYALRNLNRNAGEGFDLEPGVNDQVYAALDRRHPDADLAVAETRGIVLSWKGDLVDARYASTCGGKTAAFDESFDGTPVPYLVSHDDDLRGEPACRTSKVYRWEERWSGSELVAVLSRTVPAALGEAWKGTRVVDLRVTGRGPSGRAVRLEIETDAGRYSVEKGRIRAVLATPGGAGLRSTGFDLEVERRDGAVTSLLARGRGWGHGVGMCQWGAMQLATEGEPHDRILAHYYPGATLRRLY